MIFGLAILVGVLALLFGRFENSTKEQRSTAKFKILTAVYVILTILAVACPKIEDCQSKGKVSNEVKTVILKDLENNLNIANKWKVLINRGYPGKETFSTELNDYNSLRLINDLNLANSIKLVYEKLSNANERIRLFTTVEGYRSGLEVKRIKDFLDNLIKDIQNILKKMAYVCSENLTDEEVISINEKEFKPGLISGDSSIIVK